LNSKLNKRPKILRERKKLPRKQPKRISKRRNKPLKKPSLLLFRKLNLLKPLRKNKKTKNLEQK